MIGHTCRLRPRSPNKVAVLRRCFHTLGEDGSPLLKASPRLRFGPFTFCGHGDSLVAGVILSPAGCGLRGRRCLGLLRDPGCGHRVVSQIGSVDWVLHP